MAGRSEISREDISWHKSDCPYRRFMGEDRESNLTTEANVRKELEKKHKREVMATRPRRGRKRKGHWPVARNLLTPHEVALIDQRVDNAMDPSGPIWWYMNNQRKEFDEAKLRFINQCDCINPNTVDKTRANTTPAIEGSLVPIVKEEPAPDDDDDEYDFMRF